MNDTWGTREQPSDQEPHQPGTVEHLLLALGVVSMTAAILLAFLDNVTHADHIRGLYSILTGLFVVGMLGCMIRFGQARIRRQAERHHAEEMAEIEDLRAEIRRSRVDRPTVSRRCEGQRYMSTAVGGQGDTVPLAPKVDRPQPLDRDSVIEEGFELGYRARDAELKTVRLPSQMRRLTGDK